METAAEYGHLQIVQYVYDNTRHRLVHHEAEHPITTLMHYASANGHVNVILELLKHNEPFDHPNRNGETPMMLATANGHATVVRTLLGAGANPKHRGGHRLPIPLEIFPSDLMEADKQYDMENDLPMAVHLAAKAGHADILSLLSLEVCISREVGFLISSYQNAGITNVFRLK